MQYTHLKNALIFALTLFLSFNASGQEPTVPDSNRLKIVFFGSSVPAGEGATNHNGYTSIFSEILKSRISESGIVWETANISIGGDNTIKVLNRYETDLLPQKGRYVVFALSLGNEGIRERGQPVFDQFESNMKALIDKARSDGYVPVITNCYTRNDYNEKDYRFIKEMNLLIHRWNVPSINLLGAIDDLSGHWADGFWADGFHPNDAGHTEMAYTIVPSLFEALEIGKPAPEMVMGSYIRPSRRKSIAFAPEHIVHPFTTVISFRARGPGILLHLEDAAGTGTVSIDNNGRLVYLSPKSGVIAGTAKVNDNQWHKVIITHYYAKGATMLYCDSALQGTLEEKLLISDIRIGGGGIPKKMACKNWLFYRSGMNPDEVRCLAKGSLLRSSLELYAPLDGKRSAVPDQLINLAQSTNTIREIKHSRSE